MDMIISKENSQNVGAIVCIGKAKRDNDMFAILRHMSEQRLFRDV